MFCEYSMNGRGDIWMTFGEKLRKRREGIGYTREELGRLTSLSVPAIAAYELGERKNPLPVAKFALASALKCKPSDLDDDREETR